VNNLHSTLVLALLLRPFLIGLIVLSMMPNQSLIAIITQSQPTNTINEDIFLVNNQTTKVLRVPYLHQNSVEECWLYAMGMIVAYYTGSFDPDLVLNKVGKGFNTGLQLGWNIFNRIISPDFQSLYNAIRELYGIEFTWLEFKDKSKFIDLVVYEISNGRPLYFLGNGEHAIVITGYHKNSSGFYIVVNDPSGYYASNLWNSWLRFDGSIIKSYSEEYGVLVDINKVYETLGDRVIVSTIKNAPLRPNPPEAIVYSFTQQPEVLVNSLYDSSRQIYEEARSYFYHNNYLSRSLWYPISVVNDQSYTYFFIYVYPNTLQQREFVLEVNVTQISLDGRIISYVDELDVIVYNYSHVMIVKSPSAILQYTPHNDKAISLYFQPGTASVLQVEFRLIKKATTRDLTYKWGPIEVYVYHDIAYLTIVREGAKIGIIAGIIYQRKQGLKTIDLYISFEENQNIKLFELTKPCQYVFHETQPSPFKGGYYYTCKLTIPLSQDKVNLEGILRVKPASWLPWLTKEIPISVSMLLPSSGFFKNGWVELNKIAVRTGSIHLNLTYSITLPSSLDYKLLINVNHNSRVINLGTQSRGNVVCDFPATSSEWFPVEVRLTDELGYNIDLLTTKIVNPFVISLSNLFMPSSILSNTYSFIHYNLSIPRSALISAEINVFDLAPSAAVLANNTLLDSTTWVEKIWSNGDNIVFSLKSAILVPPCRGSMDECIYVFSVIPILGIKYKEEDIVYVYSPEVSKSITTKVYAKTIEAGRIALVLVIDKSGSMEDEFKGRAKLDWAKEAAINLVNLTFDGDYLGLIAFSTSPYLLQDIIVINQSTRTTIINKIQSITAGGWTNIGDSLKLATDLLNRQELIGLQRAIILLTDGIHNTGTDPRSVLEYVKNSGIKVYTIGLGELNVSDGIDEDLLQTIADETGGLYFYAPTPDKLKEIFNHIRGMISWLNMVDSSLLSLAPGQEAWMVYPLDYSSDFIAEVSWITGSEPLIVLRFAEIVVDQYNASSIGVEVSYPSSNTIRLKISSAGNTTTMMIGQRSNIVPINISIINMASSNAKIEIRVFGGRDQLLELILDNPAARYMKGQYLYYRVVAEKGKKVIVTLSDSNGLILYHEILSIGDSAGPYSGTALGYIKLPETPGTYYLKASLIDIFQLKTQILPILITDTPYSEPLIVNITRRIEGYGLFKIHINMSIRDRDLIGTLLITQAKIEPKFSYAPIISVQNDLMIISSDQVENYLLVNIPPYTRPGFYNISLILHLIGHSLVVINNAVEIYIPEIKIDTSEFIGVVTAHKDAPATHLSMIKVTGESSIQVNLEIRPVFPENKTLINGSISYRSIIVANTTLNLALSYNTSRIGVYPGYHQVLLNGTLIKNIPQVLVVLPKEADPNKTIWGYGFNEVTVGPDLDMEITARLRISWKGVVSGLITVASNPKSNIDYIVYAYASELGAKGILTIAIPSEYRRQGYILEIVREGVLISSIELSSQVNSIQVDIEPGYVYRVFVKYIGTPSTTTTTTSPISWTTITKTPIIGGGGKELLTTSQQPGGPPLTRLYNLLAIIAIILVLEIVIIYIFFRRRK